jgi:hypothetical protein
VTPIEQLLRTKETLSTDLRQQILADIPGLVPDLIAILKDEKLGHPNSPAAGFPPIHAVSLLVDAKATEAIEPLLDMLAETSFDHTIHERILERLPDLGAAVLEPALACFAKADDDEAADSFAELLATLDVKDPRIFEIFSKIIKERPVYGAILFADYGDPDARPMITDVIANYKPDFTDPDWHEDLDELLKALVGLGGKWEDVEAHIQRIEEARAAHVARTGRLGGYKIGRNDRCPCGSEKKYKKCCLGKVAVQVVAEPPQPD